MTITDYIEIFDGGGSLLVSPLKTKNAERVEELMQHDYVQIDWNSTTEDTLPVGSYIMWDDEKFSLIEPYKPEQKSEREWHYQPQFQSRVMSWNKVPLFYYTYAQNGSILTREPDWNITDLPSNIMTAICKALKNETGEVWTFQVAADLLTTSISLTFNAQTIFGALNSIVAELETEWRADKNTNTLYIGKAKYGTLVTLEVGTNIGVPSITSNSEGYYNRFYVFGSTRNITQDYRGANVNNLVNKRLTLSPTKYPNGYIDVPREEGVPIFQKILTFDDVYPRSNLTISNLRPRLMYRLDADGNKVQVGTNESGDPIYDMYSIWYFQIENFEFNDSTYGKDNPDGMLIAGKSLSVHFKTGALTGREFELIYHPKCSTIHNSDGQDFNILAGDYEIKFIEESGFIIPMQTNIVPDNGDEIILFNIRMPQEYISASYEELEEVALKEIAVRFSTDLSNYTFKSNPLWFSENSPALSPGRCVLYRNGNYEYETRILRVTTSLESPYELEITVGNEIIKGNSETVREEVVSANTNIDLLTQLNQLTQNVTQAYQRTQQLMLDGFARIGQMWQFDGDGCIYTPFTAYSLKGVSALGRNPNAGEIVSGGGGSGATTLGGLENVASEADMVQLSAKILVREASASGWSLKSLSDVVGLDVAALGSYLSVNGYAKKSDLPSLSGYATEQWVNEQGFLKQHQSLTDYATKTWVEGKGYLTQSALGDYYTKAEIDAIALGGEVDLSGYALKSEIPSLAGYATEQWVLGKNYLTSANLNGYATQTWVNEQGFLKEHQSLADYLTKTEAAGSYVNKSGDTMTGALNVPQVNINGAGSTALLTANAYNNAYMSVSGEILTVWDGTDKEFRTSFGNSGLVNLGRSDARWGTLFANTINVTSADVVTSLNADMLDGRHFVQQVDDWNSYVPSLFKASEQNASNAPTSDFTYGLQMVFHRISTGYRADIVTSIYSDTLYYRRYWDGKVGNWRQIAFTTDNVASATKLATARKIWGVDFDGSGDVDGLLLATYNTLWMNGAKVQIGRTDRTNYADRACIADMNGSLVIDAHAGKYIYFNFFGTSGATSGDATKAVVIAPSGNTGFGVEVAQYRIDANGVIHSNTGVLTEGYVTALKQNTSSDARLKEVVGDAVVPIDVLVNAPSVMFRWKQGAYAGQMAVGTIAQYWQEWMPLLVSKQPNGYLALDYGTTAMVSVINLARYTKSEIELAKEEIKRLKERIVELEKRIA